MIPPTLRHAFAGMNFWLLGLMAWSATLCCFEGALLAQGQPGDARDTLVRAEIVVEIKGAKVDVEVAGRQITGYRPTIIQGFPATGIVMDDQEHVLTFLGYGWVNLHNRDQQITIYTRNGQACQGKMIGIDEGTGIAVILAEGCELVKTPLCTSCEIAGGATVIAPDSEGSGFSQLLTAQILSIGPNEGILSQNSWAVSLNRPLPGIGQPVINSNRQVVGFVALEQGDNSPKTNDLPFYSISQLLTSADKILRAGGNIHTGWLGVLVDPPQNPGQGITISRVEEQSPAQKAGMVSGDVFLKWNGIQIQSASQLIRYVQMAPVGSKVNIEVLRRGVPHTLRAIIETRKTTPVPESFSLSFANWLAISGMGPYSSGESGEATLPIGMDFTPLTPEFAKFLEMPVQKGLLVTKVQSGMPAGKAGVMVGDVILSVDGQQISDSQALSIRARSNAQGGKLSLRLLRKGTERNIVLQLP
jgi:serine protease Do